MTTICYRAGVLAGDSLVSLGGLKDHYCKKVWEKNGVLIGGCGTVAALYRFKEWLYAGMPAAETDPYGDPYTFDDTGSGMIVAKGHPIILLTGAGIVPVYNEPFYALGSGCNFATAAMKAGASAREAVEIAISMDCSSGGPIHEVRH